MAPKVDHEKIAAALEGDPRSYDDIAREVAALTYTNTSRQDLWRWSEGAGTPRANTLLALAHVLHRDVMEFTS